jgi:Carboxypeptidase regulatory-like domain
MKFTCFASAALLAAPLFAQSLGNTGTIEGTVVDPSGAAVASAAVMLHNAVTGYTQSTTSSTTGTFRLGNLPPNRYHVEVNVPGFSEFSQEVEIRNAVPVQVKVMLAVASETTSVTVEGAAEALEVDPSAHVDTDRSLIEKLPVGGAGSGLSQAITYSTGGVAADANGFFHPVGDHAQVSFMIDGQPISDQQSKVFSTQLPTNAIQSMELTTGTPNAEFGDKTSLVVQATTRSGLGAPHMFGSVDASYGTFGQGGGSASLGFGTAKFGNFLAADGVRSGRFLDTPEFQTIHDAGNNGTLFDRIDYQPNGSDAFHLNLFTARNWTQIPNSYDQLTQDQKLRVLTWSIAPGYQHTVNSHTLITVNPYIRKDQLNYYASRDYAVQDTPATQSQQRQLLNWGVKADVAAAIGHHNFKYGFDAKQTRLLENFQFGVTDPAFNSPCITSDGEAVGDPALVNPSQCSAAGFESNIGTNPDVTGAPFSPSLLAYDLSRGGQLFVFHQAGVINQAAFYAQDGITLGRWEVHQHAVRTAPRLCLQRQTDGHGASRGVCAHDGNAVQRESAAIERYGSRRFGANRVRIELGPHPGRLSQSV